MRLKVLLICCWVLSSVVVISSEASAKIIVHLRVYSDSLEEPTPYARVEQWDAATGTKILRYNVISGYGSTPESVDAFAIGLDGYLYAAGNTLGFIDVVRLNTATGLTVVPPDYDCCGLGVPFASFFGGPVYDIEFDPHGDLFAAANDFVFGTGEDGPIVRRFDGQDGAAKGEITFEGNRFIHGIGFPSDGARLYVLHGPSSYLPGQGAREVSTYSYSPTNNTFTETSSFLIGAGERDLAVGPDGLLYISNLATNAVDRYTPAGVYVDQFIDEYVYDLNFLESKLLGLTSDSRVIEINPLNGSVVRTLIDASAYPGPLSFYGLEAISVVPEPSSIFLSLTCLLTLLAFFRRRPEA